MMYYILGALFCFYEDNIYIYIYIYPRQINKIYITRTKSIFRVRSSPTGK